MRVLASVVRRRCSCKTLRPRQKGFYVKRAWLLYKGERILREKEGLLCEYGLTHLESRTGVSLCKLLCTVDVFLTDETKLNHATAATAQ